MEWICKSKLYVNTYLSAPNTLQFVSSPTHICNLFFYPIMQHCVSKSTKLEYTRTHKRTKRTTRKGERERIQGEISRKIEPRTKSVVTNQNQWRQRKGKKEETPFLPPAAPRIVTIKCNHRAIKAQNAFSLPLPSRPSRPSPTHPAYSPSAGPFHI